MRFFLRNALRSKSAIIGLIVAACIVAYLIFGVKYEFAVIIIFAILVAVLVFLIVRYVKLLKKGSEAARGEKHIVFAEIIVVLVIIAIFPVSALIKSVFGVVISNGNRASSLTINQMSKQDKEIYNSMINNYIGDRKKGSEVRTMIENVITQNDDYVGERGRFISIKTRGNIPNYYRPDVLKIICDAANVYDGGVNTQENVDAAKAEMRLISNAISPGRVYAVEPEERDGIIHTVYIKLVK